MTSILPLILSLIISGVLLNYLFKYLIGKNFISFKGKKTTKNKVLWAISCCAIYIVGYVSLDFLDFGIIGFNIGRGILLSILISLLLIDPYKN